MELQYAREYQVDYYTGGYALIGIEGTKYLLVPEGKTAPEGIGGDVVILQEPLSNIYVASSAAMDLFLQAGAMEQVDMTSTSAENWTIPEIREKVLSDDILYVGKYSAPDYEVVLDEGCGLAVENTMITHSPEVREKLEQLGIPVLVERSSYEESPLGRVEWIKLYGLLTGTLGAGGSLLSGKRSAGSERPKGDTAAKWSGANGGIFLFHIFGLCQRADAP